MKNSDNQVLLYVYLAFGSVFLGIIFTFVLLFICQYYGIDLSKHFWLVGIPVMLAATLNVIFIELFRKFKKR